MHGHMNIKQINKIAYFSVIPETGFYFREKHSPLPRSLMSEAALYSTKCKTPRAQKMDAADEIATLMDLHVQFVYSFCSLIQNERRVIVWLFFFF